MKEDRNEFRQVALTTLRELAEDREVPPEVRLQASAEILDYVKWEKHWVGEST